MKTQKSREATRGGMMWGRDEMNLAEFPLALLANRAPRGCKTLTFEDRIWDKGQRRYVDRRLTISGCDHFGLPTALDDEVILGLIQLTKLDGVRNRRVLFSRYHLIRLLDWRDEGKSYRRLDTSLNRWVGVTLYYDNAWWNREHSCWMSERFHLLDNVVVSNRTKPPGNRSNAPREQALSSFTWNDVMFRSLQAGNLRKLNMDVYRALRSSIAKRMYRFLDKHFYKRGKLELDLKQFAFEHIGLSRSYDVAQIKRRLEPGIRELEDAGILRTLTREDRFHRQSSSTWVVVFETGNNSIGHRKGRRSAGQCRPDRERGPTARVACKPSRDREWEAVERRLASLDAAEMEALEQSALEAASEIARDGYWRAKKKGDDGLACEYRQQMVVAYLRAGVASPE